MTKTNITFEVGDLAVVSSFVLRRYHLGRLTSNRLKKHNRVLAHVNNMEPYAYRPEVSAGLVIPERDRALIELLIDQSYNSFRDVVEGKGQSMNILSGGPPGTGKTLTAEIFAEYKQRPLYSVQCSQLGVEPEAIEKNLSVILQRANRWNAILLLDEADVYIRARGEDMHHNAIVGVFLRVLEYAECVLFMTTNRAEMVDDAIASRCIVKIGYDVPEPQAQAKIWRTLADLNSLTISNETIATFVVRHPRVSGRDVKNLLKLASFIAAKRGAPIEVADLEFALQYKPTASASERSAPEGIAAFDMRRDVLAALAACSRTCAAAIAVEAMDMAESVGLEPDLDGTTD